MSNREAKAALSSGKIYIHDAPTADAIREIEPGDVEFRAAAPRARPGLDPVVVFRDPHLAIVIKPAGMLSVPAANRRGEGSVLASARRALGPVFAVHRLDEGTSGVMMVARTETAQHALKLLLERHDVERRYLAIVSGRFGDQQVDCESLVVRDRGDGLRGSDPNADDGKRAVSHFKLKQHVGKSWSLLEARIDTGRTHQIRIHLAELGFPVLGDPLYGDRRTANLSNRLALHAEVLGFRHPVTNNDVRYVAPLADDLARLIRR